MSQHFLTPDRLYDRPFAAAHPFARSPSAGRRVGMLAVFFVLCCIIGGYLYVTDAQRVRRLAESELSRLIGAPVTVGRAKLSIFEGLRLEYVNVYTASGGDEDSIFFSANTFLVNYDFRSLLTGKLRLTQLIAIDPQVQLVEDLDTGTWNYQPLRPANDGSDNRGGAMNLPALPEIILRNAMIHYSEIQHGRQMSRGSMAIEGQLAPSSDGQRYSFELQSRGGAGADGSFAMGPLVTGTLNRTTGQVVATLKDFQFGRDIRSMLPAQVRAWWDRHGLAGAVDVPVLSFMPGAGPNGDATFEVVTNLRGVKLTVRPEEWMSRDEIVTQQMAADAFDSLRAAGLNNAGVVDVIAKLVEPAPIQLGDVTGAFEFNEKGVTLRELHGSLEKNAFTIDGRIEGYSPLSPATIKISAASIEIPETPHYITSMPRQVRELYDHLRPRGQCALEVTVERPSSGARIEVAGKVHIIDGNFMFDRFPYPVRRAVGDIIFGYDAASGMEQVKLVNLKGNGAAGGPNSNSIITLNGAIGPLTGDAGVQVTVACDDVQDEPILMDAFPPEVRTALRNLDADGKGEFPKYKGGFECRIHRPIGPHSIWIIDVDVDLRDASGKMVAFPYFLEHVTGKLAIREGYVDIIGATMKKPNDASLVIDGRVTWRAGVGGKPLELGEIAGQVTPSRPDLKITARNVPIDKALLDALPEDRRAWLQKAGLTGKIDIDGRVWHQPPTPGQSASGGPDSSTLTHVFDVTLRDGTIWPNDGTFAISALAAKLHLLPDRVTITDVTAKRGDADLTGRGEVSWPHNNPSVFFSGTASKLALDRTLYKILPTVAQQGWDAVKPEGVVDVDLTYRGAFVNAATTQPTTAPSTPDIDLIIHPRQLAATVQAVPYRLTDIKGAVRVNNSKVTLTELSGKHNDAAIRLSGSGSIDKQSEWDLRISATDVKVDDEFRKALPAALASLVESMKLSGVVSFEFPRLLVRTSPPVESIAVNAPPPAVVENPIDVDFTVKLALRDASMDVGVAIEKAKGAMELNGSVRRSKLAHLEGPLDFEDLTIASRKGRKLHAEFYKPSDQDALRIGSINGELAGGAIAGGVDLVFPETGASRYVMNLILRNADLRELTAQTDQNLSGELSASLAVEGDWSDARSRRGRGDVAVRGREMYKMPLVLGLLQITNLTLPITSPFNEGSARYSVEGQTVTFEALEMRSNSMLMSGSGQLDFGTKKVRMTFTTDNPNWPKVPILGDIVQTAKHELLQIHVKGTLETPKVSATAINTFTTTVDEVLRGDQQR